jgi:hypothetical protein
MPRAALPESKIGEAKKGSYYIRPWIDVLIKEGLQRVKRAITPRPAEFGKRGAMAKITSARHLPTWYFCELTTVVSTTGSSPKRKIGCRGQLDAMSGTS